MGCFILHQDFPLIEIELQSSSPSIFKIDNQDESNIRYYSRQIMSNNNSKKDTEKKWKKLEQDEMKEEAHQLELKEAYETDEAYEESDD